MKLRLKLALAIAVLVVLAGVAAGMSDGADSHLLGAVSPAGWTWDDR